MKSSSTPMAWCTVIAQDSASARVLMVAWANREALAETAASGGAVYWSRSRKRLWRKGEESGHRQKVVEIRLDCDGDVVLYAVEQTGGIACHTGRESCFFRRLEGEQWQTVDPVMKDPELMYGATESEMSDAILKQLADVIDSRKGGDAAASYVARLFALGDDAILKKIGEEATETVLAAKGGERERIVCRNGRPMVSLHGHAFALRPAARKTCWTSCRGVRARRVSRNRHCARRLPGVCDRERLELPVLPH